MSLIVPSLISIVSAYQVKYESSGSQTGRRYPPVLAVVLLAHFIFPLRKKSWIIKIRPEADLKVRFYTETPTLIKCK